MNLTFDRERQLICFEEMVEKVFTDAACSWKFHDRVLHEQLPGHILRQSLTREFYKGSTVYLHQYYEPTDSLLVAVIQPTARRRRGVHIHRALKNLRVHVDTYSQWRQEGMSNPEKVGSQEQLELCILKLGPHDITFAQTNRDCMLGHCHWGP